MKYLLTISVAAEDAGVVVSDIDNVHMRTRYTTCISEELGGSGNPSIATGQGKCCIISVTEYSSKIVWL